MKKQIITIDVDEKGNVSIDVEGVDGHKCLDITKSIEEKLGGEIDRKMKKDSKNIRFITNTSDRKLTT